MKIKINGEFYIFFNELVLSEKLDSVASAFSFLAYFDYENKAHRNIFKPLQYNEVEIFDDEDNLRFTGYSVNTNLSSESLPSLQSISGYSKTGILEDVNFPYKIYPLEKNNVNLTDLTNQILKEYGLELVVENSAAKDARLVYKKIVAEPTEKIKSFLSKLASQRNLILSHDENGNLVYKKINEYGSSKFFFTKQNTISMSLSVNGQSLFSEITVFRQPSSDGGSVSTVDFASNNLVKLKRNNVSILSSGDETDTKKLADNILAAQLKNISISVSINKFLDLKCGDVVEVMNEEIFLFERARLVVSELTIKVNENSTTIQLNLVLPKTFNGQQPKDIFNDNI